MRLTKVQGISCFAAIVAFTVFSVALFVMPVEKNTVFWLGYVFALYALIVMFVSLLNFFNKQYKEEKFLNLPVVVLSWSFLTSQMGLSFREITNPFLSYTAALTANLITCGVFTVLILAVTAATNKIEKNDAKVVEKILFIDTLKNELKAIDTNDTVLKKKIATLLDDVTYSDPMSHSRLAEIEDQILEKTRSLSDNVGDVDAAIGLCDEISKLIKNRNNQCTTLKKVKDSADKDHNDGGGNKIAIVGIGVALLIILAAAALVLYIVPEKQYKNACELMDSKKYDEAIEAFVDLGDYKDSPEKIEEIHKIRKDADYESAVQLMNDAKYDEAIEAFTNLNGYKDSNEKIDDINTILKDAEYDSAVQLMNDEKYEEAITAFTNLNGYRDSNEKIDEIGKIIFEEKYNSAEEAFNSGDYDTALSLYKETTPYKESRDRIIDINNRLSSEDIMYLGTYNNEPIAWKIVEMHDYDEALLLADKPVRNLPISDDIADVSYEDSYIAKWLEEDFTGQFTEKDNSKIIETEGKKVFLLSDDDVERIKKNGVDLKSDSEWWIRTESSIGFKYVSESGDVTDSGDIHLRDKGVRPAIWINLK